MRWKIHDQENRGVAGGPRVRDTRIPRQHGDLQDWPMEPEEANLPREDVALPREMPRWE